ncbi:MAG: dTDP-4-dehydrorhamnose reductase [Leptolyngbya sp. SIO4C1]|nr:dTDP-4-dehydrorhamnose reductase [Leptolyngbya sp. SIO4C1]
MRRILLTGVTGQLGYELKLALAPLGEVISASRAELDLSRPADIHQIIEKISPHIIVNPAAYTAVDKAETETQLAQTVNAEAAKAMAEASQNLGASLVHISTDYVFDGQQHTPYTEADCPHPISVYGKTKLMGEAAIQEACDHHYIFRTAWVYGAHGQGNFVKTMLKLGRDRTEVRVVADQIGTPTSAAYLAARITQFVSHLDNPNQPPPDFGIYHLTCSGAASWYDFAVAIFEEAKRLGMPLKVQQVVPITTADYPTAAQRPAYSILSNQKIDAVLGPALFHWREGLRRTLAQLYRSS